MTKVKITKNLLRRFLFYKIKVLLLRKITQRKAKASLKVNRNHLRKSQKVKSQKI